MSKTRYIGSISVYMPKLGRTLNYGDIIEDGKIPDWEVEERIDMEKVIEEEPKKEEKTKIMKEENPIISESIISEFVVSETIKDIKKGGK